LTGLIEVKHTESRVLNENGGHRRSTSAARAGSWSKVEAN